MTYVNELM